MIKFYLLWLLTCHFFADFFLQSDNVALNKSKDNYILAVHCFVYGFIMMLASLNVLFGLLLGFSHFGIDYYTSKWSAKCWNNEERYKFFVVIGLDQLLHTSIIIILI